MEELCEDVGRVVPTEGTGGTEESECSGCPREAAVRERWQEKGQEQEKGCSWNESKSNSSAGPPSFLILAFD